MIRRVWAFLFGSARPVTPEYHLGSSFARAVLPKRMEAVTFWRHVHLKRGIVSAGLAAHERRHVDQYARLGVIRFLMLYWFYQLRDGYKWNPLEQEAREASWRVVRKRASQ